MNTINRIEDTINDIPKSYKNQLNKMTISDYSDNAIKIANDDMKTKVATNEDMKKIINTFENRLVNLSEKDKLKTFLKDQIEKSELPDVYKKANIKIIDNER